MFCRVEFGFGPHAWFPASTIKQKILKYDKENLTIYRHFY